MTVDTKTQTIDLTPTWGAILPSLLMLLMDGDATGRKAALEELQKMAALADSVKDLRELVKR